MAHRVLIRVAIGRPQRASATHISLQEDSHMKVRMTAFLTALAIFAGVSVGSAQVQTGDISGRVADNTGAVLPGVTVTATSHRRTLRPRMSGCYGSGAL